MPKHAAPQRTLVLGAAGSGKTTFLVERFVDLVRAGEDQTLMLVQSRKAARAAQERILRALGRSVPDVRVATWHAFAIGLLDDHKHALGRARIPALLTAPEQFAVVREMIAAPEERRAWGDRAPMLALHGFAEALRDFVLRAQDEMLDADEIEAAAVAAGDRDLELAARFFRRYLDVIDHQELLDHGNAIAQAVALLQSPEAGGAIARPRHVLVDDYHDVSIAQETLLHELAGAGASVTVAGNPDARIFGFRGTSEVPLERFEKAFTPADVLRLSEVHRGTPAAQAWSFEHLADEAAAIARECLRLHVAEDVPWGEIAVIVRRYGPASRAVRRALARRGVPHVVVGENRSLAREQALRPMLDLARAAVRAAETDDLLPAILASPVCGLDPYDVRALRRAARLSRTSIQGLMAAPPPDLPERLRAPLEHLRGLLGEIADRNAKDPPDEVFSFLWGHQPHEGLPYFRRLVEEGSQEDLDAVEAFAGAVRRFSERRPNQRFADYLDVLDAAEFGPEPWVLPEERRRDAVRVMTATHAAGLEFEATIVAGCVEGEFPRVRSARPLFALDDAFRPAAPADRRAESLAAERRLFGVATSRARGHLLLTASRRTGAGDVQVPSPFVSRLGVEWAQPAVPDGVLDAAEAIAAARRTVADRSLPKAERVGALERLARLPGVDPGEWWYERDWTDPGVPIAPEDLRTSYSRLSSYENCPLQYLYQVELGLDPTETHQMQVGSWVHEIIDRCAKGELPATEEALLAALAEKWNPDGFPSAAIEHRRRLDSEEMLRRWLKTDGKLKTLASEVGFEFPIDGAVMRGVIDRIVRMGGRSVRLIDYKTSRNARGQRDVDDDLQLASYFLALKRDPDLAKLGEPRYLELAFLGAFWQGGFIRRGLDVSKRPEYEEEAERRLVSFVAGIKSESFAPSPEADCQWCRFKVICPVWPEGDEVRT